MHIGRQFVVFVGVGLFCAMIDIGAMQLTMLVGRHYFFATSVGFILGLIANYALHAKVTFNAGGSPTVMLKFLTVVILNYLITLMFVFTSVQWMQNALVGKVMSLPLVAVIGFLLSRFWIFK
jgi:putative flippase GtrA